MKKSYKIRFINEKQYSVAKLVLGINPNCKVEDLGNQTIIIYSTQEFLEIFDSGNNGRWNVMQGIK